MYEAAKMLTKLKSITEKAMTNKVESDNSRTKLMQQMTALEDFLSSDSNLSNYQIRSKSRVLEQYQQVSCNDAHWKVFEIVDDFIID